MSKALYAGIDSLARKIKKMYIGIEGVARKVKKGYIGGMGEGYYGDESSDRAEVIAFE